MVISGHGIWEIEVIMIARCSVLQKHHLCQITISAATGLCKEPLREDEDFI